MEKLTLQDFIQNEKANTKERTTENIETITSSEIDLFSVISAEKCSALNEHEKHNILSMIRNSDPNFTFDENLFISSLVDPQLIMQIRFNQPVDISSVNFIGLEDDSCPKKIHLYVNKADLDFDDIFDHTPAASFEFQKSSEISFSNARKKIKVKLARFKGTRVLTVFVEDNFGGEVSVLKGIKIYGHPVEDMGTKKLTKGAETTVGDY